jgi:serine/threonine kinase 32
MGGGMQVVLGETGSWSELAKHDTTLPADAKLEVSSKPTGMLSFLKSKKGRGHSPKPQERGIMSNKEGGRIIIANGD